MTSLLHRPGLRLITPLTLAALALPTATTAQTSTRLDTITVESTRLTRSLQDIPGAVSVVDARAAQQGQQRLQLDESLARVPGLHLQNRYNFAQNQRLSSRGFGARAPFGVRGLRIRVDGFPETLPDGQSQVDSIDLDSVERISVLRGASSVLYGNATGGVIDIETARGDTLPHSGQISVAGGSDALRKLHLHHGGSNGRQHHYVGITGLHYHGERDQSEVEKYLFNTRLGWHFSGQRELQLLFSALDIPYGEDPGGLTRQQAHQQPRQATAMATRLDAGQVVRQQRLGLLYSEQLANDHHWRARAFVSRREFDQQLPFPGSSLIDYQRWFYGAGAEYHGRAQLFGLAHRLVVGAEIERQEDDRGRRSVNATGAVTGVTADEDQAATSAGIFIQTDTALADTLILSLGARADRIELRIDDHLLADGDDSGRQHFNEGSYSAGLTWLVHADHSLYATISSAFETPTFTELANPAGGGFDPNLKPQKALNRELGARGLLGNRLSYDMALFNVQVKDEITPYEISGRTFYRNAARTRREGLELSLQHFASDTFTTTLAWTWAQYRFDRFVDAQQGEDVKGNRLPGLPRHMLFAEAAWRPHSGWFVIGDVRYLGDVYAENTNDTSVGGHTLVNTRAGRSWQVSSRQTLALHVGVNNVFDRQYYANLRINANSDRPVADRGYFEPGPGRTFYSGATLTW
ncbi:TonB-dependent receptor family protein [Alcanivorax quisquiliarum]|uniref:TonB-dependent receptor n=1 Tax=Alcanivorax quisquiliarum TaxID=2933565 RepID=A0ABT0E4D1_9GAMM|nr:TonB-dependent receptor [Alcanivorax quisquiliarum]MCK0536672.1 TonB-dependent receptor [Alcanivorax quisquiliarum]